MHRTPTRQIPPKHSRPRSATGGTARRDYLRLSGACALGWGAMGRAVPQIRHRPARRPGPVTPLHASHRGGPAAWHRSSWRRLQARDCFEYCVLLATVLPPLPTTPAGAFHATSSELSHPRARRRGWVRAPLSETTLLYRTIQDHWATFLADLESGGGELPAFVLDEFELTFVVAFRFMAFCASDCRDCGHSGVVSSRVSAVVFAQVVSVVAWPTRQLSAWITFFPKCLLGSMSSRYPMPCASRWPTPRRHERRACAFISAINSTSAARTEAQAARSAADRKLDRRERFGSSLNLNVHFHVIAMDGVYAERPDGTMLFHPLPAPATRTLRAWRALCAGR